MTAPIDSYCFRRTSLLLYTYWNIHKPTLLRTVITILFKLMIFPSALFNPGHCDNPQCNYLMPYCSLDIPPSNV